MKRLQLLLQSDYEVDPNRIVLTVHPNDYNEVAAMIRAGLLLKGEPQTIEAEEWAEVELLAPPAEKKADLLPCKGCNGKPVDVGTARYLFVCPRVARRSNNVTKDCVGDALREPYYIRSLAVEDWNRLQRDDARLSYSV